MLKVMSKAISKVISKALSTRSALIVAAAIATLGLGSPAFAATYGGFSSDSGNLRPSYYDKNGWHPGLPPGAKAAQPRGLHPQNDWFWGGSPY